MPLTKFVFTANNWTPVAVADATNFTSNGYAALQNGTSDTISLTVVSDIFLQGLATVSTVNQMLWARDSTLGGTLTALVSPNSNGPLSPQSRPLATNQVPLGFIASTTPPQRSNSVSVSKIPLCLNTFGGIARWQAALDEEWGIYGNGTTNGESSISSFSGVGPLSSAIFYEPQ